MSGPRRLHFAVGTSLLTASLSLSTGCAKPGPTQEPHVNEGPTEEPAHVNEGPVVEPAETDGPSEEPADTDGPSEDPGKPDDADVNPGPVDEPTGPVKVNTAPVQPPPKS